MDKRIKLSDFEVSPLMKYCFRYKGWIGCSQIPYYLTKGLSSCHLYSWYLSITRNPSGKWNHLSFLTRALIMNLIIPCWGLETLYYPGTLMGFIYYTFPFHLHFYLCIFLLRAMVVNVFFIFELKYKVQGEAIFLV